MPVEVLAGAVVAHGGARVGVSGGDLHVERTEQRARRRRDLNTFELQLDADARS